MLIRVRTEDDVPACERLARVVRAVRVSDVSELILEAFENEDRSPAPVTGHFSTGICPWDRGTTFATHALRTPDHGGWVSAETGVRRFDDEVVEEYVSSAAPPDVGHGDLEPG